MAKVKLLCSEVCALRTSEVSPEGEAKKSPSVTASRATFLLEEGKGPSTALRMTDGGVLNGEVFAWQK